MISFYRYIFCKSYHFCINVLNEDEFPFFWATSSVVILIFANIISALGLIKYIMYPSGFENYSASYKYVILVLLAIVNIYMYREKRYLKHVDFCKQITIKRAKVYRVLSIFYYLVTVYAFYKSADLLRNLVVS